MGEPTTKTPVVYLTEQTESSFRKALERAGLLDRDDLIILYWRDTVGVKWPDVVAAAGEEAARRGAKAMVIDTFHQFAGINDENDAGEALRAMRPIQQAAGEHDLAVFIVGHDRKSGGDVGVSARGSSAFVGAVDVVLSIRRPEGSSTENVRVIHALSRFDETPSKLVIELVEGEYRALGSVAAVAKSRAVEALYSAAPWGGERRQVRGAVESGPPRPTRRGEDRPNRRTRRPQDARGRRTPPVSKAQGTRQPSRVLARRGIVGRGFFRPQLLLYERRERIRTPNDPSRQVMKSSATSLDQAGPVIASSRPPRRWRPHGWRTRTTTWRTGRSSLTGRRLPVLLASGPSLRSCSVRTCPRSTEVRAGCRDRAPLSSSSWTGRSDRRQQRQPRPDRRWRGPRSARSRAAASIRGGASARAPAFSANTRSMECHGTTWTVHVDYSRRCAPAESPTP